MRNPPWNRNELILALDLYFKLDYGQMDGRNKDIIQLSYLLSQIGTGKGIERSVNSVSLKLANFKRIDPDFPGKGMKSGSLLDEEVWNEFAGNKSELKKTASKLKKDEIKSFVSLRKKQFINWLAAVGKPDGTDYQSKTIQVYANQIENTISREFELEITNPGGLYAIDDVNQLLAIEKILNAADDSKRRRDLRSAFQNYLRFVRDQFELNDSSEDEEEVESRTEGGKKVYISIQAERDLHLRNKAIALHGTSCMACKFNFGQFYGKWGQDYIEVHHLIPLGGSGDKKRKTNPKTDLIVLCANCHRMVHRKKKTVLTLEELKQKIITV